MGAVGLFAWAVGVIGYFFAAIAALGVAGIVLWLVDRRYHIFRNEDVPMFILIAAILLGVAMMAFLFT